MNVRLPAILLALVYLAASSNSSLGQTLWQAGTDDWFTAANWTLGVPNSASGTTFDAIIANGGTAQLQAPGGSVRRLRVGLVSGTGHLLVDAGTLNVTDDLYLNTGSAGLASMTVRGGSTVTAVDTVVGFNSDDQSSFLITGAGTVYNATISFVVGGAGAGLATLTVDDGAVLASGTSSIGPNGAFGTATVNGAGSRWSSTGAFAVGSTSAGTLNIQNEGVVHVGTALNIGSTSNVNLNGGTLRFNTVSGLNRLTYTSGTIQLAGNRTFSQFGGGDFTIGTLFGVPATIPSNRSLRIEGTASIFDLDSTTVTVNGGALTSSAFDMGQGMLAVINGGTMVTTNNALVGFSLNGSHPKATVSGAGSSWTVNNMNVGAASLGTLNIQNQALVYVNNALAVNSLGTVNLNGGTLRFNSASDLNRIIFTAGTIQLGGSRNVGSDGVITHFYGATPTIVTGKKPDRRRDRHALETAEDRRWNL